MIKTVRDNSTIIQAFKDKNLSTGLYVVSFQLDNIEPIPYKDQNDILVKLTQIIELYLKYGEFNSEFVKLRGLFKGYFFSDMKGKIDNTPYLVFFVNEEGINSFGFFFNVECDDKLRFCKDWRKYVKG